MPVVKIELDQVTYETLIAVAIREWRPTQWQAEMLLRKAIREESSAAEPALRASTTDTVEHQAHK
jgi:hypothetical protein